MPAAIRATAATLDRGVSRSCRAPAAARHSSAVPMAARVATIVIPVCGARPIA